MASPEKPPRLPFTRRFLRAYGRSLEITKAGWLFIVLTLAVGFAAINSGSNLLHALFGVQMTLVLASGVLSEATVNRIEAVRRASDPVFARVPAILDVEVRNRAPHGDALSVSIEDDDTTPHAAKVDPAFCVRVPAGARVHLTTTTTLPSRGWFDLPQAVVKTAFPFGLFVKRKRLDAPARVLVYPHLHEVSVHELEGLRDGEGERGGRLSRDGDFFGLRDYREGDELRRIHWPAVARVSRIVVRELEARGDRTVVLSLAAGRTGDPAFENRVEHVASLAMAFLRDGGTAVGLQYADDLIVAPGSGNDQVSRILDALATLGDPTLAPLTAVG